MLGMQLILTKSIDANRTPPGSFVSIYKFLLNALPFIIPSIRASQREYPSAFDEEDDEEEAKDSLPETVFDVSIPPTPVNPSNPVMSHQRRRTERFSLSTQAQRILIRKKTKRWHAALAGAIAGGLGVMSEPSSCMHYLTIPVGSLGDQR